MLREVGDNSFLDEVENQEGVVIVDFWASWCGPCRMLAPVMEELEKELGEKVSFVKVNVDDNPQVSSKYRVASIPTVILFDKGKVAETMVGFRPKKEIQSIIERYI